MPIFIGESFLHVCEKSIARSKGTCFRRGTFSKVILAQLSVGTSY